MQESPFTAGHFEREDDAPDPEFYVAPRLLVHIDDYAIEAARRLYAELLPTHSDLLDLMSSYRSHMPIELQWRRLAGLGLNETELRENDQLTEYTVHDLNADPTLPYPVASFDGAVVTVSVQYMTRPVEIFRDVGRVLRPDAPFIVTYSGRAFWTKAVAIWRSLEDRDRATLIGTYFKEAGCFGPAQARDCRPQRTVGEDPLFGVWATKV